MVLASIDPMFFISTANSHRHFAWCRIGQHFFAGWVIEAFFLVPIPTCIFCSSLPLHPYASFFFYILTFRWPRCLIKRFSPRCFVNIYTFQTPCFPYFRATFLPIAFLFCAFAFGADADVNPFGLTSCVPCQTCKLSLLPPGFTRVHRQT